MAPIWNHLLKKGLQEEMITLWVSNSKSSQAKVTSEKSLSSLCSVKDTLIFPRKSFHFRRSFSSAELITLSLLENGDQWGKSMNIRYFCDAFVASENSAILSCFSISQGHDCPPGFELFDGNIKGRGFNFKIQVRQSKTSKVSKYFHFLAPTEALLL